MSSQNLEPRPASFVAVYTLNSPLGNVEGEIYRTGAHTLIVKTGPFEVQTSQLAHFFRSDGHGLQMQPMPVIFPNGRYLIIYTEREFSGSSAYASASVEVNGVAAKLTILFPGLLAERKFEGFIDRPGEHYMVAGPGPMRLIARPDDDPQDVAQALAEFNTTLGEQPLDKRERFRLAARWYAQGYSSDALIDKLLSWYTSLEVHPAAGTTDIPGSVRDYLHKNLYADIDPGALKERCLIGRIAGVRADIVHNGKAHVDTTEADEYGRYLDALERIARTCLRLLGGLPPGDALDKLIRQK